MTHQSDIAAHATYQMHMRDGRVERVGQFLIETVVLSAIGVAIPRVITYAAGMPTVVTPWSVALAYGISGVVGVVFGLYPAVRAARLDPIEALRHE